MGDTLFVEALGNDPDNDIVEWSCFINGVWHSGEPLELTGSAPASCIHTFQIAGLHRITVTYVDSFNEEASVTWTALVDEIVQVNNAPQARRSGPSRVQVVVGEKRNFSASSTDSDGDLVRFEFLVDDRVERTLRLDHVGSIQATIPNVFDRAGRFSAEGRFTDSQGRSNSVYWEIEVIEPLVFPPQVVGLECLPESPEPGTKVTCRPALRGDSPALYRWNTVSGSPKWGNKPAFSTHWDQAGGKLVSLEVCNLGGCHEANVTVWVEDRFANANLQVNTKPPFHVGSSVEVGGSAFPPYVFVDQLAIGGVTILPNPAPQTDGAGGFAATILVPGLNPGSYKFEARAGKAKAVATLEVEEPLPLNHPPVAGAVAPLASPDVETGHRQEFTCLGCRRSRGYQLRNVVNQWQVPRWGVL